MATLVDARVRQERDYGNAGGDEGLRRVESDITDVDEDEEERESERKGEVYVRLRHVVG